MPPTDGPVLTFDTPCTQTAEFDDPSLTAIVEGTNNVLGSLFVRVSTLGDDQLVGDVLERIHPFLEFPPELRRIVYTTNAIEGLNARFRRAVRHRGRLPNEQAALKILQRFANQHKPGRLNLTGRIVGWKTILDTLTIHYGDRLNGSY